MNMIKCESFILPVTSPGWLGEPSVFAPMLGRADVTGSFFSSGGIASCIFAWVVAGAGVGGAGEGAVDGLFVG